MEEKKVIKVGLGIIICVIVIVLLVIALCGMYYFGFIKNNEKISELKTNIENIEKQKNEYQTKTAQLEQYIALNNSQNKSEEKIDNSDKQSDLINNYEIGTIKNINDVISDNDTKTVKAQKIAKEVMSAVNNKNWYYLAKMVGTSADAFIKYGIYNYNVDINDYSEIGGKYVFDATYETRTEVNESMGRLLIITFEDGGRIVIEPNCTGV